MLQQIITNSLETNEKENISKEIRDKEELLKTPKLQTTQMSFCEWVNKLGACTPIILLSSKKQSICVVPWVALHGIMLCEHANLK